MKLFKKLAILAMTVFAFTACEDVPAPYNLPGEGGGNGSGSGSGSVEGVLIDESFSSDFGVFKTVETEGNYPWIIDFKTAKATSYVNGQNERAQSWLIADPIDLTGLNEVRIVFDYIIRYAESGKVAANHQLLISDNYAGDPTTATWTNIDYGAVEGVDWTTFAQANVSIPQEYTNKSNITIALKYSAASKAGTWEVKNFLVEEGQGATGGNASDKYIDETFANDFGSFTLAETVGDYPWIIDYSTAKATSYINNENNAAESWLISPAVDFSNETEAYVAFEYIIRYAESGKVAENHQLLISDDYTGDPATATWTNIDYSAVEGVNWTTFEKANVAVPQAFMGKAAVTFALKYSANEKAGTWEVKNFVVAHGAVVEEEEPEANEYTVAEAIAAFVDGQNIPAIVTGYIVGTVQGMNTSDAIFGTTNPSNTNLILADDADEKDIAKCLIVQLPSGDIRNALSLAGNAANYKKRVKLTGDIAKYYGVPGLKNTSAYEFVGEGGDTPSIPGEQTTIANAIEAGPGAAKVSGTVLATYARGFIVNDGTASILVYLGSEHSYVAGDVVTVEGNTSEYAGMLQFGSGTSVEKTGTESVSHPTVSVMSAADMDAYLSAPVIKYVQYTGKLTIKEYYYNVEISGATKAMGSISYPAAGMVDASLDGKEITVTGYTIGVSSSKYVNTMAVSVVAADGSTTPDEGGDEGDEGGITEPVVFDFTNPTSLTPSITPAEKGKGIEFDEVTFTNGDVTITALKNDATTKVRIWTKNDLTTEFRSYNKSTITISGKGMKKIVFDGNKVSTMTTTTGTLSEGTWTGDADSVTFNVTGTLNINTITVE